MPLFRKTLRKEHLLDRGIYSDSKGHLADRIKYAWEVYNSPKAKYTTAHKDATLEFLKTSFSIPPALAKGQVVEKLTALMALKAAVKVLIQEGADTSLTDYQGFSILHHAVLAQNKELVIWILDNTSHNVNQKDREAHTPLYYAELENNNEIKELLRNQK